jgi:hypothetical protein
MKEQPGDRYGELTLVEKRIGPRWWCRCDCGTERCFVIYNLRRGSTKTCGNKDAHPRKSGATRT